MNSSPAGETLAVLLDYIEQVVRLDERVALRLADYRLPDGSQLVLPGPDVRDLPGIALDGEDEDGPVWLRIERLVREPAPNPPDDCAVWLEPWTDPAAEPKARDPRVETAGAAEARVAVAAGEAAPEDYLPIPAGSDPAGVGADEPPPVDRILRLDGAMRERIEAWVTEVWSPWAEAERARRRTIEIYRRLYRLQQQLEIGGRDGAVEALWGIGTVEWTRDGRSLERPLLECALDIELDTEGQIRIRPRAVAPRIDLAPFEAFGCERLSGFDDAVRRALAAVGPDLSPFRPATTEPVLRAAATHLASNARYEPVGSPPAFPHDPAAPRIRGDWVIFARPRSQHVLIDDIERFRAIARGGAAVTGLAARLVAAPADQGAAPFTPLSATIGTLAEPPAPEVLTRFGDVFFPKPFNDDQLAIVERLERNEGLVVQGPPGTGKTHTIANLVCHAMALGRRVLVVSRGEAALAVLRDQLPEKVRPLVISILASERQGLRQVETAIREIQGVIEESRPEIRLAAIRRCEAEILKVRDRLAAIDHDLDRLATSQATPVGPDARLPAELAQIVARAQARYGWFVDRPAAFLRDCDLGEDEVAALRDARRRAGALLGVAAAAVPRLADLPDVATVLDWHRRLQAAGEPDMSPPDAGLDPAAADGAAEALLGLAEAWEAASRFPWLPTSLARLCTAPDDPWSRLLGDIAAEALGLERERARLAALAIDLPEDLLDEPEAREAIARGAAGERPWPRFGLGRTAAKTLVAAIRLKGAPLTSDPADWAAVAERLALADAQRAVTARWQAFAREWNDPEGGSPHALAAVVEWFARLSRAQSRLDALAAQPGTASITLSTDPEQLRQAAGQLMSIVEAAQIRGLRAAVRSTAESFAGADRMAALARQFLLEAVGRPEGDEARLAGLWSSILERCAAVDALRPALAEVERLCARVAEAGAPAWGARLRTEPPDDGEDRLLPADWAEAWDHAATAALLERLDQRALFGSLTRERDALDRRGRKLFVELVRERAFHALDQRLSPRVKSALVEYVRALGRLGKGTGKTAGQHRLAARDAMARCYDAIPCWIMPTWRVAEQLPADLAAFDLVILDEASQSDVTELPALLRGRKILAVGDDRQVSPTPPFVSTGKIDQLRHHYLRHLPYRTLLEPGESLYDLMRAVFPDSRLMLKEHFRCVEPIIRFCMQFYPEKLVPLRVPTARERLDPPLVDLFVPHGRRDDGRKINRAEAEVIVEEIAGLAADPQFAGRTIGVISLIGGEQAELIRVLLTDRIGDEAMQRHMILCGDSATFQGNERDIVFLSLVADRRRRTTLTMLRYEQRFNVAVSRARDRLVLVRSVGLEDLASRDLKARLIAHFEDPLPRAMSTSVEALSACDSDFERDLFRALVERGYRVEPQVGAEGFRIDLVVEGQDGKRLAVECDGDRFHGPEQWRDDMRRQRILERVGWRFWRCFASSFYREPDAVLADLVATLEQEGIAPAGPAGAARAAVVERRIVAAPTQPAATPVAAAPEAAAPEAAPSGEVEDETSPSAQRLGIGDRVVLLFADRKRLTLRLTEATDDPFRGFVAAGTAFGRALAGVEAGDEIDWPEQDGASTRAFVEAIETAA